MRNEKFFILIIFTVFLIYPNVSFLRADDYSSTNFILRDPVITVEGGRSTSTSFEYFSSTGQSVAGEGTSSNFIYRAGFLYFPASVPTSSYEATATNTFNFLSGGTTTFTNTNNTKIIFNLPVNFYTEDLKLQWYSYANNYFSSNKPAISGKDFVGKTYDFNLYTSVLETQIYTVSVPITITLNYTDFDISGIDKSTLAPYRWGTNDSSWQLIPGFTNDTINKKVTFSTASFSSFALFGQPIQSSGGGSISGGGSLISSLFPNPSFSPVTADLNSDGKVDIVDLSIFLYYADRPYLARYDFNKDVKIDLVDISILLFYWA